jgi:hypothetical protein
MTSMDGHAAEIESRGQLEMRQQLSIFVASGTRLG